MHVVVISWQGGLQLLGAIRPLTQGRAINQDVMMSGVFLVGACGGHLHPLEAKFHFDRGAYGRSILKIGEIHFGPIRSRGVARETCTGCKTDHQRSSDKILFHCFLPSLNAKCNTLGARYPKARNACFPVSMTRTIRDKTKI